MSPSAIADDIRDEAVRLGSEAVDVGLPLRLIGGLAVWTSSPSMRDPSVARSYADMDFAAESARTTDVKAFFAERGYVPERLFNALHGARRLNFAEPSGRWTIDVLLDELRMSHAVPFRGRLATTGPTIDLADLLLTKLQIWEINRKDLVDAAAILADHELTRASGRPAFESVDLDRIAALTAADWGLGHTVDRNLAGVASLAADGVLPGAPHPLDAQVAAVRAAIEAAPKSLSWRARARIGERVRWYETPEEVRH